MEKDLMIKKVTEDKEDLDLRNENALLTKRILYCNQITFSPKDVNGIMLGFMSKNSVGDVMDCEVILLPDSQAKYLYEWLKGRYEGKETEGD